MIKNNTLTYTSAQTTWYMWEPTAGVLSAFIVAIMITLITFQASGLVFDVLLTLRKAPKSSGASKLGIVILTWKLSPLAVLNSVCQRDWIARMYYGVEVPCPRSTNCRDAKVSVRTWAVLVVLLACGPLLDIFFITLTLERTRTMTFAEAGFHPVAFGIDEGERIVEAIPHSRLCKQVQVERRMSDELIPNLLMCMREPVKFTEPSESVEVGIFNSTYGLALGTSFLGHWIITDLTTYINFPSRSFPEDTYVMSVTATKKSASSVIEKVLGLMTSVCRKHTQMESSEVLHNLLPKEFQEVEVKSFLCENSKSFDVNQDRKRSERAFNFLLEHLTLVDSDDFLIAERQTEGEGFGWITYGPDFVNGIDLPFVQRREMNISFALLMIILFISVLLRLIIIPFTNNDLYYGIERIVKDELGLGLSESLLSASGGDLNLQDKVENGPCPASFNSKDFAEPSDFSHCSR